MAWFFSQVLLPFYNAQMCQIAGYGPWRPFLAPLLANARVTAAGHERDTRLLALGLRGSGLAYAPGDLAAILPAQVPCAAWLPDNIHALTSSKYECWTCTLLIE